MASYGTFDVGGRSPSATGSARCRVRRRPSSSASPGASVGTSTSSARAPVASAARRPCLVDEASASWLSRLGFLFVEPLVALGGARRLRLQDLWTLEPENTAAQAERRFRAAYRASGHLLTAIWRTEWRAIVCSGGLGLCSALSACCVPVLLFQLLTAAMDPSPAHKSVRELLLLLVGIHAAVMLAVLFDRHARFKMFKAQLRVVASIRLLVFAKSVEKPVKGRHGTSTSIAVIATLYSSNLVQVSWLLIRFHDLWTSTVQLSVLLVIMHRTLHTSATMILASLAAIIGSLSVLTAFSARMLQWYTKKRAKTLAVVNECFKGIQSIKLYAWEDKILSKIMSARRKEEKRQWWEAAFRVVRYCCVWESPAFASVAIFTSLAAHAGYFSPATVFTALILIDHVQVELHGLIMGMRVFIDGRVGLRKIDRYLLYLLGNVNLRVNEGELVVIHGKAGAGKTTLLTAFLGDVACVNGSVYLSPNYKIAYCSEQPWLQTLSIKENVIFGYAYDEAKYYRVLDACCLLEDLESLPNGDDTMIGPKGINLSGGQKSRIALARTLYSDADVYLLDRPLASADAIVQSDVFRKCFLELLRYKTVIIATHNPEVVESDFVDRLCDENTDDEYTPFAMDKQEMEGQFGLDFCRYVERNSRLRRAKGIFSEVTQSLLRAPMSVLNHTPIGEILARYSTDMQVIDVFTALTVYLCRGMVDKRLFAQVYTLRAQLDAADLNFVSETLDGAAVIRSFGADQINRVSDCDGRRVVFDNVFFKYDAVQDDADTSVFALKDVSFSISGGEKIGIVGRTGSGKSSLAMAMLQMHRLPRGRILIDGIDISRLHLRDIRSRICIIPQTPLFYRGSIRRYLDPFKEFDDDALWEVLVKTGLSLASRVVVTSLDMRLAENGENWSMGERQMLVLARSLLKPARVLILDEAFSSVDQDSDKRLLAVVEKEFASSTIFLITHRLDQVLGFDRIIVMKDGAVAECGAAEDLVTDPDSAFYDFLETTLLTY
uniref:ABC transporter domain-containing protein n=1 Tax=Phytophthora ramorum TaxID=164328 RepID=H3HCF6_PHYRM